MINYGLERGGWCVGGRWGARGAECVRGVQGGGADSRLPGVHIWGVRGKYSGSGGGGVTGVSAGPPGRAGTLIIRKAGLADAELTLAPKKRCQICAKFRQNPPAAPTPPPPSPPPPPPRHPPSHLVAFPLLSSHRHTTPPLSTSPSKNIRINIEAK